MKCVVMAVTIVAGLCTRVLRAQTARGSKRPMPGTRNSRGWSAVTTFPSRRSTSWRCGFSTRLALAAGCRRFSEAHRPVFDHRVAASYPSHVCALRFLLGSVAASGSVASADSGVHNSGWAQSPGAAALEDANQYPRLKAYVQGVIGAFAKDNRILAWDVWNEPGADNAGSYPKEELKEKDKTRSEERRVGKECETKWEC